MPSGKFQLQDTEGALVVHSIPMLLSIPVITFPDHGSLAVRLRLADPMHQPP
jgi:hypothetical protein